jgi:hypothetical protein
MRPTKIFVVLGILFLTTTAVRADKVTFDYDHNVNFSKYRTFMWMQEPETADPFMKERIVKSVNLQLTARGLREVKSKPDLVIGAGLATEEKQVLETYYTGGWGWDGGGFSTTEVRTYFVGTLTVDLIDSCTHKVIWQGVATDRLSRKPEKRTKESDKWIAKMFRGFPPGFFQTSACGKATNVIGD